MVAERTEVADREQLIPFIKLCGAGNDFVLLDARAHAISELEPKRISALCDRRRGIGADGLLLIETADKDEVLLRYFNADGTEADLCGNGGRCAARYLAEGQDPPISVTIRTPGHVHQARVLRDDWVRFQMPSPTRLHIHDSLDWLASVLAGEELGKQVSASGVVNTGVPHLVLVVSPKVIEFDTRVFSDRCQPLRFARRFGPEGVNVNWVVPLEPNRARIRTYERGVEDETLACGTGCVAAAVVLNSLGKANSPLKLITKGEDVLVVDFAKESGEFRDVWLEGPVSVSFRGRVSLG